MKCPSGWQVHWQHEKSPPPRMHSQVCLSCSNLQCLGYRCTLCPCPHCGDGDLHNQIRTWCSCCLSTWGHSDLRTHLKATPWEPQPFQGSGCQQEPHNDLSSSLRLFWRPYSVIIYKGKEKSFKQAACALPAQQRISWKSFLFLSDIIMLCFVLLSSLLSSVLSRGPSGLTGIRGGNYNDSFVYICSSGSLMWWKYSRNIKLEALSTFFSDPLEARH